MNFGMQSSFPIQITCLNLICHCWYLSYNVELACNVQAIRIIRYTKVHCSYSFESFGLP